jgi:uncharacterized protein YndB with AHSA1/START domain
MTSMRGGKLIEGEDGRAGVRFERRLAHPPERVWRAVTETEELAKWFPARPEIAGERRVGAELSFTYPENTEPPETGEIVELVEPSLFAFTWRSAGQEPQLVRFELAPDGDGTTLVFTHELPRPDTAKVAAGWELCLDDLEDALAGEPRAEFPEGRWVELHEEYAEQFGVSPEPGREAFAGAAAGELMEGLRVNVPEYPS